MKPVWVVDDDRSIRWVLEKTLTREGIPFKSFSSASDAWQQLEEGLPPPQVLISDIRMPGQSGLDLLQQVKNRYPQLPVIIMTAYSDLESAVAAFQGGAFEYLPKPFDVDQAVDLVAADVDRRFIRTNKGRLTRLQYQTLLTFAQHGFTLNAEQNCGALLADLCASGR